MVVAAPGIQGAVDGGRVVVADLLLQLGHAELVGLKYDVNGLGK
jgi:hypothetical protein